jgi:hypothetical protein
VEVPEAIKSAATRGDEIFTPPSIAGLGLEPGRPVIALGRHSFRRVRLPTPLPAKLRRTRSVTDSELMTPVSPHVRHSYQFAGGADASSAAMAKMSPELGLSQPSPCVLTPTNLKKASITRRCSHPDKSKRLSA